MDKLKILEEKRLSIYREYRSKQIIGLFFVLSGIILVFLSVAMFQPFLFVPAFGLLACAIYIFSKAHKESSTFQALVKDLLVKDLLQDSFNDVLYEPKDSLPLATLMATEMVKKPDRYRGEDYIEGTYKGVSFQVSDVHFEASVQSTNAQGQTTTSYETYFKGRWYIFRFNRKFKDELKIIEKRSTYAKTKHLTKVETESIIFNQKFNIWSTDPKFAFYQITPVMIEKMLVLENLHRGSIFYYYVKNELHVGVNDRRDYMEIPIKKPINQESISRIIHDIDLIPAIINEMSLSSSKYMD